MTPYFWSLNFIAEDLPVMIRQYLILIFISLRLADFTAFDRFLIFFCYFSFLSSPHQ